MKNTSIEKPVFIPKQIIVEFLISFQDKNNIETGITIKKLADGNYFIPTGISKKTFTLTEIKKPPFNGEFFQLPFTVGVTDFAAPNAMKKETFDSFLKAFKSVFCLPKPKKK